MDSYNGWKNYETWNVALWIGNDESLYSAAQDCSDYAQFVGMLGGYASDFNAGGVYGDRCKQFRCEKLECTPDGVNWQNPRLDVDALDAMIKELKE